MKIFVALAVLFAITGAEPPPSHSYLPPPPNQRSKAGYSNGGYSASANINNNNGFPQVVAARSPGNHPLGVIPHGISHGIGNGYQKAPRGFAGQGHNQGYDQNAAGLQRSALEQQNLEPANYNFEYMVNDFEEGAEFGHQEERFDDSAHGQYHVVLPDGRKQTVSYEADGRGFKPRVSYEDAGDAFTRSSHGGYESNANRVDFNGGRSSNQGNGGRGGY